MHAALAIAELDNMAEDGNHQRVGFFVFVDLVGHQLHQALLLAVQHQGVDHTAVHHRHIKGAADIVCNSHFIRTLHIRGSAFCRNHNHRNVGNHMIFIHQRHHDIQQEQVNIGSKLF